MTPHIGRNAVTIPVRPATQYAEFFPYVDKLWFGESFQYNRMSADQWLIEVSGIPFGLMGDMLQGGGNRWLGMVYGMTARMPWTSAADPRPVIDSDQEAFALEWTEALPASRVADVVHRRERVEVVEVLEDRQAGVRIDGGPEEARVGDPGRHVHPVIAALRELEEDVGAGGT